MFIFSLSLTKFPLFILLSPSSTSPQNEMSKYVDGSRRTKVEKKSSSVLVCVCEVFGEDKCSDKIPLTKKNKSRMKIKSGVVGENRFFSPTVKRFLVILEDEHCKQQLFKSIKAQRVRAEAAELELLALQ